MLFKYKSDNSILYLPLIIIIKSEYSIFLYDSSRQGQFSLTTERALILTSPTSPAISIPSWLSLKEKY
jgi:hypothetical protein